MQDVFRAAVETCGNELEGHDRGLTTERASTVAFGSAVFRFPQIQSDPPTINLLLEPPERRQNEEHTRKESDLQDVSRDLQIVRFLFETTRVQAVYVT